MDLLKLWKKGKISDEQIHGSVEYRAKKKFMADFVRLLYSMGGYEFARQYEWSTCKSQPNCLKLKGTDDDPVGGLVAVDFRAGLALLPFLPMSPGDFKLILKGLCRGSLVQFDRGSIQKLRAFVKINENEFSDMKVLLGELEKCEQIYRDSIPDITHNHIRLFYSRRLWTTMHDSAVTGWRIRNLVDGVWEQKFKKSKFLTLVFFLIGLIPILGKVLRKSWARADWRKHYKTMLTNRDYLKRSIKARITEKIIAWHRAGRISDEKAIRMTEKNRLFFRHLLARLFVFAWLERFCTDRKFAREQLHYIFVRPVKLYFNAQLREQWLRDMVSQGQKKHILTDEDAGTILSQMNEPYIQKYLKSLAVHICTLPVTQIVSFAVAAIYVSRHPELTWKQAWVTAVGIVALFQVVPVSPGSLVRGFWVVYMMSKDKDFRNYNIAIFLGFFKYIGYLAFPIQMAYHFPAMARFMASHWATEAVHIVPVFGERGALFEHWIFRLFYNWPLTIRRRMTKIIKIRETLKPRYWHIGIWAIVAAGIFGFINWFYLKNSNHLPGLMTIWWAVVLLPFVCGGLATRGCRGAPLWKRIVGSGICGAVMAVLYSITRVIISNCNGISAGPVLSHLVWGVFVFSILSTLGAIFTELKLADPDLKK
ncbi:MAG: hypothetical protein ACYSSI_04820 [Planctomycetota bacterium]|jgi:hypothetical protein